MKRSIWFPNGEFCPQQTRPHRWLAHTKVSKVNWPKIFWSNIPLNWLRFTSRKVLFQRILFLMWVSQLLCRRVCCGRVCLWANSLVTVHTNGKHSLSRHLLPHNHSQLLEYESYKPHTVKFRFYNFERVFWSASEKHFDKEASYFSQCNLASCK